jgi:hypothetical protein
MEDANDAERKKRRSVSVDHAERTPLKCRRVTGLTLQPLTIPGFSAKQSIQVIMKDNLDSAFGRTGQGPVYRSAEFSRRSVAFRAAGEELGK